MIELVKRLRQLFSYSGSKFLLSVMFALYYPKHRRYVSLFGGSAGEFSCKAPSPVEVYNDLDDHLHTVWQVLQNPEQYEQLLRLLENTPNGRRQFEICSQMLRDPPRKHSPVRRAWAFLVVGNICRSGFHPAITKAWGTACDTSDKQTHNLMTLPRRLAEWRDRFRHVRIEHADWYKVFTKYDRHDTMTFADPPYLPSTLRSSGPLYRHELSIQLHVTLLRTLSAAKGCAMICGYNSPLYTAMLFWWRKVEFPARATMGGKAARRCEIIWMNYEEDGTKISRNKLVIVKRFVGIMGSVCAARRYLDRIVALLDLPRPDIQPTSQKKQTWLNYTDDGRGLPSTKMLVAKRYLEVMGSVSAAQRWLYRLETLLGLSK